MDTPECSHRRNHPDAQADPGWDLVRACWAQRQRAGLELLDQEAQLRPVHDAYQQLQTALPLLAYNHQVADRGSLVDRLLAEPSRSAPHPVADTAGSLDAELLLVGEGYGPRKNDDPLLRWPFGSFSQVGCSAWLTEQLLRSGVGEERLLWANTEAAEAALRHAPRLRHAIALGREAAACLRAAPNRGGVVIHELPHPQFHKRFHAKEPYPLLDLLKELADGNLQPRPCLAAGA